jgi:hypothetical protein
MNKRVEETATDPRDSISKYFAFHILPSNSPAIRTALTNLSPRYHVLCIRPKRSIYRKKKLVMLRMPEQIILCEIILLQYYPNLFISY